MGLTLRTHLGCCIIYRTFMFILNFFLEDFFRLTHPFDNFFYLLDTDYLIAQTSPFREKFRDT